MLLLLLLLSDRLKLAMTEANAKPADLARACGVSTASVSDWLSGESKSIKAANLLKAAKFLNVSPDWLATGQGHMRINQHQANEPQAPYAIDLKNNPDYPAIKRVKFKLSAGVSGFAVDYDQGDNTPLVFNRQWYESNKYIPTSLFAVSVINGSMEPGLNHNDVVVVNTDSTTPKDGRVFAVNYEGEMVIKRLVRDAGQWWLSSDNPDQRRYPRKVCDEHCIIIGEVIHKQSETI